MRTVDIYDKEEFFEDPLPEAIAEKLNDPGIKDVQVFKGKAPTTQLGKKLAREKARKLAKKAKRSHGRGSNGQVF